MGIARPLLKCLAALGAASIAACSLTPRAVHPPPAAATLPAAPASEAGLDWHPLLPAPFGTFLKDMPLSLHEVLLFHDDTHASVDTDNKDCYAADRAPPAFLGGVPRVYLFCFSHDRLTRIEALVDISSASAYATFGRACELWHRHAHASIASSPEAAGLCEGQDVGIGFSAQLAADGDNHVMSATFTAFSLADGSATESSAVEGRPVDGGPITPPHP